MKKDKALIGAAGEHLVLSRLLARGLLASPAPRGTEKVDILVTDPDGISNFRIQVKTTEATANSGWFLGLKHESQTAKDLFFCLVSLSRVQPSVYVLPSKVIAQVIKEDHRFWLSKPSRSGTPHKDSDMRRIRSNMPLMPENWLEQYFEAWFYLTGKNEH